MYIFGVQDCSHLPVGCSTHSRQSVSHTPQHVWVLQYAGCRRCQTVRKWQRLIFVLVIKYDLLCLGLCSSHWEIHVKIQPSEGDFQRNVSKLRPVERRYKCVTLCGKTEGNKKKLDPYITLIHPWVTFKGHNNCRQWRDKRLWCRFPLCRCFCCSQQSDSPSRDPCWRLAPPTAPAKKWNVEKKSHNSMKWRVKWRCEERNRPALRARES